MSNMVKTIICSLESAMLDFLAQRFPTDIIVFFCIFLSCLLLSSTFSSPSPLFPIFVPILSFLSFLSRFCTSSTFNDSWVFQLFLLTMGVLGYLKYVWTWQGNSSTSCLTTSVSFFPRSSSSSKFDESFRVIFCKVKNRNSATHCLF